MSYQDERQFMAICNQAGWRYSGRWDGLFPSVAGTHEWGLALAEAREWACHARPALEHPPIVGGSEQAG